MRSRHSNSSSPPWWVWAATVALPLTAWALRSGPPEHSAVARDAAFKSTPSIPSAWTADSGARPAAGPAAATREIATISAAPPTYRAFQQAPRASGAAAEVPPPFAANHPWFAGEQAGSPAFPTPTVATPTVATPPSAEADDLASKAMPDDGETMDAAAPQDQDVASAKPVAAGGALLPPVAMPALSTPAPSPVHRSHSAALRDIVPDVLPRVDPPTPAQISTIAHENRVAHERGADSSDADKAPVYDSETTPALSPAEDPVEATKQVAAASPSTPSMTSRQLEDSSVVSGLGSLTGEKIEQRAKEQIAAGYDLARRGAYFAAQLQFTNVLRMIAEAEDARSGIVRRAAALFEGLRALDEAEDFLSLPADADAQQETSVLLRSHKTPAGQQADAAALSPSQLADRYYRHAQLRLAAAVAGNPAGSMALHALGKLTSERHAAAAADYPLSLRRAVAYQHAALLAREDNYLAAHELGVLLAESGHYSESADLLRRVATAQPHPVVLRNLARVERSLGRVQAAQLAEQEAAHLAEITPDPRVAWIPPGQFSAHSGAPAGLNAATSPPAQTPYGASEVARRLEAPAPAAVPPAMRFMR